VILLTGSSGFIGSRLLKYLSLKNFNTRVVLRKENKGFQNYVLCDLQNEKLPPETFEDIKIIFHLAGQAHEVSDNRESRKSCESLNLKATIKLAKLANNHNVKKFIFVSSVKASQVEDIDLNYDILENNRSKDFYGVIKRKTELELLKLNESMNMSISIVRPALVYGPNVKGNLAKLIKGIDKGWFPPIPENGNKKSLIHVDDLVRALYAVSKNELSDGQIYIATDNHEYSSREIYDSLRLTLGKNISSWRTPYLAFKLIAGLHPFFKSKIEKLMGNDFYPGQLESVGYYPELSLKQINEELF